jgi:hypothetical protein
MTTTQLAAAPANSSAGRAYKALTKLRALPYGRKRSAAFRKLDAEMQELVTEPCEGEVHTTGADGCMLCLCYSWGRSLRTL